MAIGDLISVPRIETVVQLMSVEGGERAAGDELVESFVVTEEVERGLDHIVSLLRAGDGRGILLKGNYGSGKSHLLAFLSVLLERSEPPPVPLAHAGLVRPTRHGRETRYEVTPEPLGDALDWIASVGGAWDERLEALRRSLAARSRHD